MKYTGIFLLCFCCVRSELLKDLIDRKCKSLENCQKDSNNGEVVLISCVLNNIELADVTGECKVLVFKFARDYFGGNGLRRILENSCPDDVKAMKCDSDQRIIFCILNNKEKFADYYCQNIVQRVESLFSSHSSLFLNYTDICHDDIQKLCNDPYLKFNRAVAIIEGNFLLDCLQKRIDSIGHPECRNEIFRISKFQGENMKLDQALYKSCALDRLKFCSDGNDLDQELVYKCLQEFINHQGLSRDCREELFKRENLVVKNWDVSKGLVRSCRDDIKIYHCRRMTSDDKNIRLAQILLCLENAIHNGSRVSPNCRNEIVRHRKLLMADYRLSPEVVSKCFEDIDVFCRGLSKGGKTIHCLLDHSRPRRRSQKVVSVGCQHSLEELLKITDIGEDWRVDPVLRRSCENVVNFMCSDARGDDSKVMSCLMDNVNSHKMSHDCEKALMEIQYFISRDFKLDPQLFTACQSDAIRLCHVKHSWNDDLANSDPERGPLILPCLYRYVYNYESVHSDNNIKLKLTCEEQVRRVMRQRAISVELIPEIEESCLDDLALYCSNKKKPGEEMLCLQDKYTSLNSKCRSVVGNFTEAEAKDIDLNPILKQFCKPVIDIHCKEELRSIKGDSNDMISCLIKHKNDADVRIHYKCKAAVDHFQLISLNDYHFTVAFKDACRPYVIHYCPKAHTKAQVVECLSEVTQNDTLKDERYTLSKECRYQLRLQLLQQREFIDLDPKLKHECDKDIRTLCSKINRESDVTVLECLEENLNLLSSQCHKMVFKIEQHDFKDSSSDYTLLTTCKLMIEEYCKDVNISQAFLCLKKYKDEPVFDNNCKSLVLKRMVEQSADYRLNPALQRGCSQDIGKFCLSLMKTQAPNTEFEGKILNCLKIKFRERKLRKDCEKQLSVILKEAALNYKLNPLLRTLCTSEIQTLCSEDVDAEEHGNSGRVEECLKIAFIDGRIQSRACRLEVAGLIEETKADIHVDPILHSACVLDITKYCIDVPKGAGRILHCLENILASEKHLQSDCKHKLLQRMEMFKHAEPLINNEPKDLGELLYQVKKSVSIRFFSVGLFTFVGMIFMLGLFCGRTTQRSVMLKNK